MRGRPLSAVTRYLAGDAAVVCAVRRICASRIPKVTLSKQGVDMAKPTRGFLGRGKAARDPRLPPGQYDAGDQWPVLNAEVTPQLDLASWSFSVEGLVAHPTTWTWDEIHALPESAYSGDIHCVTTWSKLGVHFSGVSVDTLLDIAGLEPTASHVMAFSHTGYTTNLPLGRCHRWSSMGRLGVRARATANRTRRTGTPVGPAPLLLEECEMGGRVAGARPRRTGVLGAQRLPRLGEIRGSSSATRAIRK